MKVLLVTPPYACWGVQVIGTWPPLHLVYLAGAAIGAVFYVAVDQFFANFSAFKDAALKGAYRNIAFGLALMICIGVLPDGIASLSNRLRSWSRDGVATPVRSSDDGAP